MFQSSDAFDYFSFHLRVDDPRNVPSCIHEGMIAVLEAPLFNSILGPRITRDGVRYVIIDCVPNRHIGPVVPQEPYRPQARVTAASEVRLRSSLQGSVFFRNTQGNLGIPLADAIIGRTEMIEGNSQPVQAVIPSSPTFFLHVRRSLSPEITN